MKIALQKPNSIELECEVVCIVTKFNSSSPVFAKSSGNRRREFS